MKCKNCNAEMSIFAKKCSECDYEVKPMIEFSPKAKKAILLGFFILFLINVAIFVKALYFDDPMEQANKAYQKYQNMAPRL